MIKNVNKILAVLWLVMGIAFSDVYAQDHYAKAKECLMHNDLQGAIANFEEASSDDPHAAYDYALLLMNGKLGKKDTALAIWHLTDVVCYGYSRVGLVYQPFLKNDDKFFSKGESKMSEDEISVRQQASLLLKKMEAIKTSSYLAVIYDAIGKCYGAEGDFVKAEEYFRKSYDTHNIVEYYCVQDARLSLGLFYLLIDCDYVEYDTGTEEGIPFENLGVVNSSSLRLYKFKQTRGENDNALFWLEQYKKGAPNCFDIIEFTVMPYSLYYILHGLYSGDVPGYPRDSIKEMMSAGEMVLAGHEQWSVNIKEIADFYYDRNSKTKAWELYRLAKCNYGMGKCYYDERDYSSAMNYLTAALTQDTNCTREEVVDALSLVSSIYRYGKGGIMQNERLADKILDVSMRYSGMREKKKVIFKIENGLIVDLDIK